MSVTRRQRFVYAHLASGNISRDVWALKKDHRVTHSRATRTDANAYIDAKP
jgi:hypothetical protein